MYTVLRHTTDNSLRETENLVSSLNIELYKLQQRAYTPFLFRVWNGQPKWNSKILNSHAKKWHSQCALLVATMNLLPKSRPSINPSVTEKDPSQPFPFPLKEQYIFIF